MKYIRSALLTLCLASLALIALLPVSAFAFDQGEDLALVAADIASELAADIEFAATTMTQDDTLHTTLALDWSGHLAADNTQGAAINRPTRPKAIMGSGYDVLKMPRARGAQRETEAEGSRPGRSRL